MVRGRGRLTKWAVCVLGGSALCPVWPVCSLFSKRLQFSACEQKRASSSHFSPLAHTPLELLCSTHHPSHSHTCAGSFPIHHLDCLKAHSSLPSPPLLRINRGLPQNTAPAPSPAASPELKPAPPLPKPAPYEYGHSSSQPQPESSSALAPLSLAPSFTDCQQ